MEKCENCQKDNGTFNMKNACCRERHFKMILNVKPEDALENLKNIRRKYGNEEADRLAQIQPPKYKPAVKAEVTKPTPPAKTSTIQAAINF